MVSSTAGFIVSSIAPYSVELPVLRVERAYARMEAWERPLLEQLIGYLGAAPSVRLIGSAIVDHNRAGSVSFVHER